MSKPAEALDGYKQYGNSAPTDSYIPGDGKQRIDLEEYYKETNQDEGTYMMQGFEQLSLMRLSKALARNLGLSGTESYDPFPSARNARQGSEGLFTYIADKFKGMIEGIIKYIRMAIDWVVDTIKAFFGYRKSARITTAINESLDDLHEQFADTMAGLGFPKNEYNLEKYLGELAPGENVKFQIVLLKSKMEKDQDAITGLTNALPLLQQASGKMTKVSADVERVVSRLKKVIKEEYEATRVRKQRGETLHGFNSPEMVRVLAAINETRLALDTTGVTEIVQKLYSTLYKIEFTNDELVNGFDKVRGKLKATLQTEKVKVIKQDAPGLLLGIQILKNRYLELADEKIDLASVDWKALGKVIDKTDSDQIKAMSDFYQAPNVPDDRKLLADYQRLTIEVRTFTQFCYSVAQAMLTVQRQAINLIDWHNRTYAYYYSGILGDIDTMMAVIKDAKAAGHSPLHDSKGRPPPMLFIKEADAETFMEKLSSNLNVVIEGDVAKVKTSFNAFAKQVGWGKKA